VTLLNDEKLKKNMARAVKTMLIPADGILGIA